MFPRPPRARSFRRPFLRSRSRKRLFWHGFANGTGVLGPNSSERLVLIPNQTLIGMTMPTLMRIRGEILFELLPTDPVVDGNNATLYIGIGPQNVIDGTPGNIAEDPYQYSQINDWMWWQACYLIANTVQPDTNSTLAAARYSLDVRSKRRFDFTDELVMMVVNSASVSLPVSAGVVVTGRTLWQESRG